MILKNDTAQVIQGGKVLVRVKANDLIPDGCSSTARLQIVSGATIATATASVQGDSAILYSASESALSNDVLTYSITCNGTTATANVSIFMWERPDNINLADCFITATGTEWCIGTPTLYPANTNVSNYWAHSMSTPLVADLDGDGIPEIISPRREAASQTSLTYAISDGLFIVNAVTGVMRTIPTVSFNTAGQSLAIADVDGDGIAEIFIQGNNNAIVAYNGLSGARRTFAYTNSLSYRVILNICDLNADGIPEILAGGYIFNAQTGDLLLNMTPTAYGTGAGYAHNGAGNPYSMPAVGDVDNDGLLEVVAGNTLYKPIKDSATGIWSYTTKVFSNVNIQSPDGQTVLVDIDLDGRLDAVVISQKSYKTLDNVQVYAWNPKTMSLVGYAAVLTGKCLVTIPFVGDIDGDKYPEILFGASNNTSGGAAAGAMRVYKYDASLPNKIRLVTTESDLNETAGYTLFDFNLDGKSEIVGRNDTHLYIIDGTTFEKLYDVANVYSGTTTEYPIVADVDNDGHAEIILNQAFTRWSDNSSSPFVRGSIGVYRACGTNPWAPTRPVWNQWPYNGVQIHDDLSVPRYPINSATLFPGRDGILGTADDVRPFNNFLQQRSILNKNGNYLWMAPDIELVSMDDPGYTVTNDEIIINNIRIENQGDGDLNAPIYFSIYKEGSISLADYLATVQYNAGLAKGQSLIIPSLTFPGISSGLETNEILLRVNDSGLRIAQGECDTTNNVDRRFRNFWMGTTTSTNWGIQGNWTNNFVPDTGEDVIFATTRNYGTSAVNDLQLDQDREIGNLVNATDKATIISSNTSLIVTGKVIGSEENPDKLKILADAANPNASLILNCDKQTDDVYASVEMYSPAYRGSNVTWEDNIVGSPTYEQTLGGSYRWQYFGIPVESTTASPTFNGSYVREYDEAQNGTTFYQKWTQLSNTSAMSKFKGYEVTQIAAKKFTIQGKLVFCNQEITLTALADEVINQGVNYGRYGLGYNIFGNSFTSAIPIENITFADDVENTVYLYNTGTFGSWGASHGDMTSPGAIVAGSYKAIPKLTASIAQYKNIPSMNGFMLRYNAAYGNSTTMSLPYSNLAKNDRPQTAPRAPLSYLDIELNSASTNDRLLLVSQPGTTPGFDNGWDGRKFFGTPTAFIFAPTVDGHMEVSTNSSLVNTPISFVANAETDYTLSVKRVNLADNLSLVDLWTATVTPLSDEVTHYAFTAYNAGTAEQRFMIARVPGVVTDNDASENRSNDADVYVVDGRIYVNNGSVGAATMQLFDEVGRLIYRGTVPTMSVEMLPLDLVAGVYVVNITIGNTSHNSKVVVRK